MGWRKIGGGRQIEIDVEGVEREKLEGSEMRGEGNVKNWR